MEQHIKLFSTDSARTAFESSQNYLEPYISKVAADNSVHYNKDPFNGHAYVDLGLPSGTLWATMNIGANSATDYGNYYQYGKGAAQYAETSGDNDYSGMETPLNSSVDTAVQVWGGSWHMPTKTQMEELIANTTYLWVTDHNGSGINGGLFTAQNGNSIFLPAVGEWYNGRQKNVGRYGNYWSSSSGGALAAYCLELSNGNERVINSGRNFGFSVRPVIG